MCSPTPAIFLELARSFSDDGECLGRMLFVPLVINLVMMIIYDHQKMRWNDQPKYDGLGPADFKLLQRFGVVGQGRLFWGIMFAWCSWWSKHPKGHSTASVSTVVFLITKASIICMWTFEVLRACIWKMYFEVCVFAQYIRRWCICQMYLEG